MKNYLRNILLIALLVFAFTAYANADGDTPIAGYQCNPAVEECPPPCVPGLSCPEGGGSSRAAVSVPAPKPEKSYLEDLVDSLLKSLLG